jgi:hypothetical protein
MPTYNFKHTESGEVIELKMKIAERDEWVKNNPDYETYHASMNIGDAVRLGIKKPPSDFQKEIIGRVARMPGATVTSKFGIPKEY